MKLNLKKIVKVAGTAYALYKANEEEVDAAIAFVKRNVKKKPRLP
jgi:hypothetical protein